eukprot:TRINITY_DN3330_c0_g2_i1.p1 TRINITY_DN3330_c0_g2~~TRINITY_DN3330_c0_g2_i1.p1  ORF type:complete len:831 (+),score=165.66 TRINITY_DN3330_c0_g2_i1:41-2533(+)
MTSSNNTTQLVTASQPAKSTIAFGLLDENGKIQILRSSKICKPEDWAPSVKNSLEKDYYKLKTRINEEGNCELVMDSHLMAPNTAMAIVCGVKSGNNRWTVCSEHYANLFLQQRNKSLSSIPKIPPSLNGESELRNRLLNLEDHMQRVEEILISKVEKSTGLEWIVIVDGDQCLHDLSQFGKAVGKLKEGDNFSKRIQIVSFINEMEQSKNQWELENSETMSKSLFQFKLKSFKNGVDFQISILMGRLDALLKQLESSKPKEDRIGICLMTNDKFASFVIPRFERQRRCAFVSGSSRIAEFLHQSLNKHQWSGFLLDVSSNLKEEAEMIHAMTLQDSEEMKAILRRKISPGRNVPSTEVYKLLPFKFRKWKDSLLSFDLKEIDCMKTIEGNIRSITQLKDPCVPCFEYGRSHQFEGPCIAIYLEKLVQLLIEKTNISLTELGQEIPISKEVKEQGGWRQILSLDAAKEQGISLVSDLEGTIYVVINCFKPFHIVDVTYDRYPQKLFAVVYKGKMATVKRIQSGELKKSARLIFMSDHPNIVKYFGVAEGIHSSFIVMESCKSNLQELIDGFVGGCLPISEALDLAIGITCGLQYIHSKNVIHYNISTTSILIGFDGKPKIGTNKNLNNAAVVPEIARGEKETITNRVDVYLLGIVLVRMLVIKRMIPQNYDPQSLKSIFPYRPNSFFQEFYGLIENCLETKPENRKSSFQLNDQFVRLRSNKSVAGTTEIPIPQNPTPTPKPSTPVEEIFTNLPVKNEVVLVREYCQKARIDYVISFDSVDTRWCAILDVDGMIKKAIGPTKKEAEKLAAQQVLKALKSNGRFNQKMGTK